jgi:hypothetical protein
MTNDEPAESVDGAMRPWRLHRSSVVVGVLLGAALVLIDVPGRVLGGSWSTTTGGRRVFEHGWPGAYLRRLTDEPIVNPKAMPMFTPRWGVPWIYSDNWRLWEATPSIGRSRERYWEFRTLLAIGDVACAALVIVAISGLWEFRRRRRSRLLSFQLADIFVLFCAASLALSWIMHQKQEYERESSILAAHGNASINWRDPPRQCTAPAWFESLFGQQLLPDFFWRVTTIELRSPRDAKQSPDDAVITVLSQLSYLSTLRVIYSSQDPFDFSKLRPLERMIALKAWRGRGFFYEEEIEGITQLGQLQTLVVDAENITKAQLSRLEETLPNCKIVNIY